MNKEMYQKIIDKFNKPAIRTLFLIAETVILSMVFVLLQNGTGVDYDEAFTWDVVANNGLRGIISATAADVHPPLYYLICKLAFCVFGKSLKVLLWVSLVPVILGMIMSSVFVNKNWGFSAAFLFNLIYGFAPFILHYNLNLRMYSWMDLFVLGVVFVTYELMRGGSGKIMRDLQIFAENHANSCVYMPILPYLAFFVNAFAFPGRFLVISQEGRN